MLMVFLTDYDSNTGMPGSKLVKIPVATANIKDADKIQMYWGEDMLSTTKKVRLRR